MSARIKFRVSGEIVHQIFDEKFGGIANFADEWMDVTGDGDKADEAERSVKTIYAWLKHGLPTTKDTLFKFCGALDADPMAALDFDREDIRRGFGRLRRSFMLGGINAGGFRPSGGASLNFDFPLDTAQDPALYQAAAITNAFYWVNLLHDIHYQYGFTEVAGNFQVNNYGHGGADNEPVIVDIQDGDGGTDSFVAMPDGQSPRMTLYRRTSPFRDRAFDSDVMVHEFGHGISERLTGGPARAVPSPPSTRTMPRLWWRPCPGPARESC